jgi:hypothetical protein
VRYVFFGGILKEDLGVGSGSGGEGWGGWEGRSGGVEGERDYRTKDLRSIFKQSESLARFELKFASSYCYNS